MFKNQKLKMVLHVAYIDPFKLQSDFARQNAQEVGCLASLGYISTQEGPGVFGNKWRITGTGIDKLRSLGLL